MGNFAGQALSPLVLVGLVLSGGRLGFGPRPQPAR